MFGLEPVLPVDPIPEEFLIVEFFLKDDPRHRQHHCCFGSGIGCHPVIGPAGSVRKPDIHHGDFGPVVLSFDDSLGMGIKIMSRFQVGTDQENKIRIGKIGRSPVHPVPDGITKSCSGGTDVGVTVMSVDTPCLEDPVHIPFMAGTSNMVGDFVVAAFFQGRADSRRDVLKHRFPGDSFPFALTPFSDSLQGIEDPFFVLDLVDGRRAFGAVSPSASGMIGITLEFTYLPGFLVDIAQQSAA